MKKQFYDVSLKIEAESQAHANMKLEAFIDSINNESVRSQIREKSKPNHDELILAVLKFLFPKTF